LDADLLRAPAVGHSIREYEGQVIVREDVEKMIAFARQGLPVAVGERDREADFTEVKNVMKAYGYIPAYDTGSDGPLAIFIHEGTGERLLVRRDQAGALSGLNLFTGRQAVIVQDLAAALQEIYQAMGDELESLLRQHAPPDEDGGVRGPFRPVVIRGGRDDGGPMKAGGQGPAMPLQTNPMGSGAMTLVAYEPSPPAEGTALAYPSSLFADLGTLDMSGLATPALIDAVSTQGTAVPPEDLDPIETVGADPTILTSATVYDGFSPLLIQSVSGGLWH
jgi:hypothetical protein